MSDAVCPSIIHLCFVRATRLDSLGSPVAGPNNVAVSDKPMMLTITPDILAGEVKDLKGGCDQLIATYRGQDIRKRFNLELDLGADQLALEEILTGDTSGNPIGIQFKEGCDAQQPFVAFEAWQDLWECDGQPLSPYPYMRWVWPASRWQQGAQTAQNDFNQPKYTGFTVGNSNWADGIFGDLPVPCAAGGQRFYDTVLPTAECGWQTQPIT